MAEVNQDDAEAAVDGLAGEGHSPPDRVQHAERIPTLNCNKSIFESISNSPVLLDTVTATRNE